MVEGITNSPAHRRDEVKLFGDGTKRGCPKRNDAVIEIIRERDIAFNPDKKPRRQPIIVAELHTTKQAAERAVGCARARVEQRVAPVSPAVSDMAADVEP